jgi:hypothetical protein
MEQQYRGSCSLLLVELQKYMDKLERKGRAQGIKENVTICCFQPSHLKYLI